jgi:hypothetical protein
LDYPKITKETPEAIDDFLETVEINLKALDKLGEPITSNVVLIKLFTSKPSFANGNAHYWTKKCRHIHTW